MIVLYPEMVQAGREAYWEARSNRLDEEHVIAAVYIAMRMVEEMANIPVDTEVVH